MPALLCNKTVSGVRAQAPARRGSVKVQASSRRELLGLSALVALTVAGPAMAGVTEDLLAKSGANKALNDKKRIATSNANFARSRTVTDGTCNVFTNNFFGCEELAPKPVPFIAEDKAIECQGTENGKCNSRTTAPFGKAR